MRPAFKSLFLMAIMIFVSGLAIVLHPIHRIADEGPVFDLETMIPEKFGEWQSVHQQFAQIINPQRYELMEKIYSKTLARSYINPNGDLIMLSIAYGPDQSDGVALHYPEFCYQAQGFQLLSSEEGGVETSFGRIRVKRLITKLDDRSEPVTYWTMLGEQVVQGDLETKLVQLKYGFRGEIPDGLIFRVSSIDARYKEAFALQGAFVRDLLSAVSPESRRRFARLSLITKPDFYAAIGYIPENEAKLDMDGWQLQSLLATHIWPLT